uniref:Apple domain-containing protein n=1 Tax=Panagrolaimus davidi TaxID=227884 RepID=A0A914Q797_9BILA
MTTRPQTSLGSILLSTPAGSGVSPTTAGGSTGTLATGGNSVASMATTIGGTSATGSTISGGITLSTTKQSTPAGVIITLSTHGGSGVPTTSRPPQDSGCNKGFQLVSSSADPSASATGKFGGYFTYRTSCEELCNRNYGLLKCIGYMYEPRNRGKCTIFQYSTDGKIIENSNSVASVFKKC